jgi:hypothetical protein
MRVRERRLRNRPRRRPRPRFERWLAAGVNE